MKGKPTKKGTSTKMLTAAQQAEIDALAAIPDDEIDTSDMPEVRDWTGAKRGLFYRPVKKALSLRIDADIIAWFKAHAPKGKGYQTEMNRALRDFVKQHEDEEADESEHDRHTGRRA